MMKDDAPRKISLDDMLLIRRERLIELLDRAVESYLQDIFHQDGSRRVYTHGLDLGRAQWYRGQLKFPTNGSDLLDKIRATFISEANEIPYLDPGESIDQEDPNPDLDRIIRENEGTDTVVIDD